MISTFYWVIATIYNNRMQWAPRSNDALHAKSKPYVQSAQWFNVHTLLAVAVAHLTANCSRRRWLSRFQPNDFVYYEDIVMYNVQGTIKPALKSKAQKITSNSSSSSSSITIISSYSTNCTSTGFTIFYTAYAKYKISYI